jgi:hypothetical protein
MISPEIEIHLGEVASRAYTTYIKAFIGRLSEELYANFLNTSDIDEAMEIKRVQIALNTLENTVLRDIDSGKMARQQLDNLNTTG